MGLGKTKVRDGPLLSPLPGRMAWSGSSISSLTPFLTQKLFSRSEKVGGASWLLAPPPNISKPIKSLQIGCSNWFPGACYPEGTCGLQQQESHTES